MYRRGRGPVPEANRATRYQCYRRVSIGAGRVATRSPLLSAGETDRQSLIPPRTSRRMPFRPYLSCTEPSYPIGVSSTLRSSPYCVRAASFSSIPSPGPSGTFR